MGGDWVHLVLRPLFGLLYQTRMIDDDEDDECGAVGGMRIGRGNWSTRRKPAPVPLCPSQIPHDLTPARTLGRCSGKPATNRLSYGTAYSVFKSIHFRRVPGESQHSSFKNRGTSHRPQKHKMTIFFFLEKNSNGSDQISVMYGHNFPK
jgi:hypothetical protein